MKDANESFLAKHEKQEVEADKLFEEAKARAFDHLKRLHLFEISEAIDETDFGDLALDVTLAYQLRDKEKLGAAVMQVIDNYWMPIFTREELEKGK